MSLFEYSNEYLDEDNNYFSGICYNIPNFFDYKKDFASHIINDREEFRLDLIADTLFGDDNLAWVLNEINNAYDASFYTKGKKIYYLPVNILTQLGIT